MAWIYVSGLVPNAAVLKGGKDTQQCQVDVGAMSLNFQNCEVNIFLFFFVRHLVLGILLLLERGLPDTTSIAINLEP